MNEFRFQFATRSQSNNSFSATGSGPAITVLGVANFGGPIDVGFAYTETAPEITDNFSFITSAHEFKIGFNTRWIRDEQVAATGALYVFPTIAAYQAAVTGVDPKGYVSFTQSLGNPAIKYDSLFAGAVCAGHVEATSQPHRDLRPAV